MTVDEDGNLKAISNGTVIIVVIADDGSDVTTNVEVKVNAPSIYYKTNVEKQGWQSNWSKNGTFSGSMGLARRLLLNEKSRILSAAFCNQNPAFLLFYSVLKRLTFDYLYIGLLRTVTFAVELSIRSFRQLLSAVKEGGHEKCIGEYPRERAGQAGACEAEPRNEEYAG